MLKYTERHYRQTDSPVINERQNIVVDTEFISRPVPYDNKEIDRELETHTDWIAFGLGAL
ncbi:hypothetical protein [Spirosoma sp. KNUC1025]|uniref:hypothetical protein n=1 Tax=Spirosoma sp. KNUC1025 TaxID=2894082 RepID=UPI00386EA3F4|nr:hypothetical protein LN737_14420 [Spirosoma sp. KNUC1025]